MKMEQFNRENNTAEQSVRTVSQKYANKGKFRRVIALLSAVVVFFTMNTLKFEADTLEHYAMCGFEAHVHDETCLDENGQVVCGMDEHIHTDACFQQRPVKPEPTVLDEYVPLNTQVVLSSPMDALDAPVEEVSVSLGDDEGEAYDDGVLDVTYDEPAIPEIHEYRMDGEVAFLSDVLNGVGMSVSNITSVGEIIDDSILVEGDDFTVESAEDIPGEYIIRAVRDFDRAELGIVDDAGVESIWLLNGIGVAPTQPVEAAATEEDIIYEETAAEASETAAADDGIETEEQQPVEEAVTETQEPAIEEALQETEAELEESPADDVTEAENETVENVSEENVTENTEEPEIEETADEAVNDGEPADEAETGLDEAETENTEATEAENTEVTGAENTEVTETENNEVTEVENTEATEEENTEATETENTEVTEAENTEAIETESVETDETEVEDAAQEAEIAETETEIEDQAVRSVALDFTNYIATDDHAVYLYDVANAFVLVNAAEITSADGVEAVTEEEIAASEDATLVITGDGEYELDGVIYTVSGLVLPEKVVTNAEQNVTIATANEESTLLNVEPVFEESAEGYADIFSLFQAAEADPTLLSRLSDALFGVAYAEEVRELQMKLFNIGLQSTEDGSEVEPGTAVRVTTFFDAIEGVDFALYHIVDNQPVLVENAVVVEDGRAIGFDFEIDSLSPFALVYYTVTTREGETFTGYSLKTDEKALNAQQLLETLGVQAIATGVTCNDESVAIDGLDIALPESFEKIALTIEAGVDKYEITLLTGDELTAAVGDYAVSLDLSNAGLDDSASYKVEITQQPATDEEVAAVEAALSETLEDGTRKIAHVSDLEMVDISIINTETGLAVEPQGSVAVSLTRGGEAIPTVVHFRNDGEVETLPVENGTFTTDSFSAFTGSYTVEYTTINNEVTVNLDFTDIVKNGVDFDTQSVITALNDGVAVKIDELEAGYTGESGNVVHGELYIDYTTADNKESQVQKSWGSLDIISVDDGLSVVDREIRVTKDGTVVLSDGETTINIVISNYERLLAEALESEGVSIDVLNGAVPAGSEVVYVEHTEEETQALISEYNIETTENTGSFDVSIAMPEGGEFTEEGQFKVTVDAPAVEVPEGAKAVYKVYHIHEGDVEPLEASVVDGKLSFLTGSFSDFVYTVDFEYTDPRTGEKITWKFPGNGSYRISDIMIVLGVTGEIGQVDLVRTVDEGGSEKVLYLEEKEGDLYLTSEEAFTDTFVLTVEVGDNLYIITVTDDNVNTSTNLNDFLADITFSETFVKDESNNDIVKEGRTYHMHLTFTEIGNSQFATTGLTYKVPDGIKMSQTSGNFTIKYNGTDYGGNSYSYDESTNTITVTFDETVKNLVAISADARFTIDIAGEFVQQKNAYVFGNDHTKSFVLDENHDTSIEKSGSYNSGDNKVHYTVTAKSDGKSENVVITDIVNGTALTYDQGSIQINGNSTTPAVSENEDGFVVTLSSMADGETVTITYTASVDFGNLTGKGTVSQTGNTVKIKADGDPEIEKPTDISNTIDYNPLQKSHGDVIGDGNTKTVPWTITVNQQQLKSMSGTEITDTIGYNSRDYMTYSGSGISIAVMDGDYTVASYTRDWVSLNLTTNSNGQETWTFKVPESGEPDYHDDADNTYKYVITYTTEVDASGKVANFDVSNDVHDDENHQGSSGTQVTPGTDGIVLVKENRGYSAATSDWEISFNVPQSGLSSAVVTDTLPNNGTYWDTLLGDVLITGLFDDESYTIDTSDPKKVVITFYKSTEKTDENKGLQASSSDRTIKVTLKTNNNSDWVIANSGDDHWNYAELSANGQVITDKDKSNPRSEGVSKTGSYYGTKEIDGRQYPIFKYVVNFYGVSDSSFSSDILTFRDDYDETYLELYNDPNDGADLCIRDRYNRVGTNSGEVSYNDNNGVLTFTANKNQFYVDNNGIYTSSYQMYYYLIVKQDASHTYLNALETASVGAVANEYYVPINNRVDWGTFHDSVTIDYKYPAVDKNTVQIDASNRTAKYEIVLNPDKLYLNGGAAMELQDSAENLSIDYSTLVITVDPAENASQVTYYYRGNTGYFSIPDGTKVTIRYSARIIGDGAVTFSNDASMKGYRDSTTNTESVSSSASGSLNIEWAMIYKHAYRKMDKPLNNAEYVLTDRNGNPVLYPANAQTFTDVNGVQVKAGDPVIFRTHTMDVNDTPDGQGKRAADVRDGYAWIFLNKDKTGLALQKGITYYLKEYTAPVGYQKDDTIFSFTIAEHPDYDDYEYYKGDILRIADSPVDGVLEIDKTFVGTHNLTDTQKKNITFEVTAVDGNGDVLEFPYTKNESGEYVTTTKLEITYADFENGVYKLDALPYGIYTVKETNHVLGGYMWKSTTYKVDEVTESNAEYSGTVDIKAGSKEHKIAYTNTYEPQKRSVNIVKKNAENTIYLYGATFQVFKKNAGTGDYEVYKDDHLTSDGKFTIDFESRTTGVTLTNLDLGEYKIVETVAPTDYVLDSTPVYFTVTASDVTAGAGSDTNGPNVLSFANEGGLPTFAIKNEIDHTYTLTKVDALRLRKKLNGAQFTVYEVTAASGGVVTLSDTAVAGPFTTDENGRAVIDAKTGYDPAKLYAVVETKAPAGYKVSDEKYFFYTGATPPSLAATVKTFDSTTVVDLHDGPKESTVPNEEDEMDLYVRKWWWKVTETEKESDLPPAGSGVTSIEVKLYQVAVDSNGDKTTRRYPDDQTTYTLTIGGAGNQSFMEYKFTGLPTGMSVNTDNPITYEYYVEEVVPEGYQPKYRIGTDQTNSLTDELVKSDPEEVTVGQESESNYIQIRNSLKPISLEMQKVWLDEGSHAGGNTITYYLHYTDNDGVEKTPTSEEVNGDYVNPQLPGQSNVAGNNWAYKWSKLHPGTPDNPRHYYVVEGNQDTLSQYGYGQPIYSTDEDGNVIITNPKYTSDKLKVKKVWLNEDGTEMTAAEMAANHAEPVTVQLQKEEGTAGEGYTVTIVYHKVENDYSVPPYDGSATKETEQNFVYEVKKNTQVIINMQAGGTIYSDSGKTDEVQNGSVTIPSVDSNINLDYYISSPAWWNDPNVTFTSPETSWTGTITDVTTADGIKKNGIDLTASDIRVTLDPNNSWMYNWETLTAPDGHTYRYSVREVNVPAGFDESYENNGVQTGIIYVKNTKSLYTRATARKEWLNPAGEVIAAPSGSSVVYTLYQDNRRTNKTVTLDGTVDTDGEFNAWEATFEGLERFKADGVTPHTYTVKETTGFTGYEAFIDDAGNPGKKIAGDTVASGGIIYNKKVRSIEVHKAWVDGSGAEVTPPAGTTVTVKLLDGTGAPVLDGNGNPIVVVLDGRTDVHGEQRPWWATFGNLDTDTVYKVDEDDVTGFVKQGIAYIVEGENDPQNIPGGKDGTATITNQKSNKGKLTVTKTFDGAHADALTTAQKNAITFTVAGPSGFTSVSKTYAEIYAMTDHKWVLEELDVGTYTVTESGENPNSGAYTVTTTYSVDGGSTYTSTNSVSIAAGDDKTLDIKNTYTPIPGSLVISKQVTAGSTGTTETFSFEVTLKNSDDSPYTGKVTVTDKERNGEEVTVGETGKLTVAVQGVGTATIDNLPAGTKYEVAETSIPDGWKQVGNVAITGGDSNQTITAGETETATITNTEVVDIEATKTWKNSDNTDITTQILNASVTLKLQKSTDGGNSWTDVTTVTNGETNPQTISATTTALTADQWKASWTNLPKYDAGTLIQYKVVESNVKINTNDSRTPADDVVIVDNAADYGAVSGSNSKATGNVINALPDTSITVSKAWKVDGKEVLWPSGMTVTVGLYSKTGENAPAPVTYVENAETKQKTVTLNEANSGTGNEAVAARTFSGLPVYDNAGNKITYSVKETKVNSTDVTETTVESATVRSVDLTTHGGDTWTVTDGVVTDGAATITNERQPKSTDIKVVKEWKNADGTTARTAPTGVTIAYKLYQTASKDSAAIMEGYPKEITLTSPQGTLPVTKTVNAQNETVWEDTISNLPLEAVDENDHKIITYSYYVEEAASTATDVLYPEQKVETHTDDNGVWTFTIINKLTDADVTKAWKNVDGTTDVTPTSDVSLTMTLNRYVYYDGSQIVSLEQIPYKIITMEFAASTSTVTVKEGSNVLQTRVIGTDTDPWKYEWKDLPAEVMVDHDNNATTAMVKAEYRYKWDETVVPSGYVRKSDEQQNEQPAAKKSQTITNVYNPSFELPSTGGPGTTGFYVLGSILTLFALVLLITKKRSDAAGIE